MGMKSRRKGKVGERQWRDVLRGAGWNARRGQQFSGNPDAPDVICEEMPHIHFEVKVGKSIAVYKAMMQAKGDCGWKIPVVAHKQDRCEFLVTMTPAFFFHLMKSDKALSVDSGNTHAAVRPSSPTAGSDTPPVCSGLPQPQNKKEIHG